MCVQLSNATVDSTLMAVEEKDIEHWKEPAGHTCYVYCPIEHFLLDTIKTISKPDPATVICWNNCNTCKTHVHVHTLQIGKKIITTYLLVKIIRLLRIAR